MVFPKLALIKRILYPKILSRKSMCLAVPGKIVSIDENSVADVDFGGVNRPVNVSLVDVGIGDYVIVHAGYAIQVLSEEDALESLNMFREMLEGQDA